MNKELKELLNAEDVTVVWDIDGTLSEARWCKEDITELDKTKAEICSNYMRGMYKLNPIGIMIEIVSKISNARQYVLSQTMNSAEDRIKDELLDENFSNILKEHRFYTRTRKEKMDVLEALGMTYNKRIVYISDSLEELIEMNKYFNELDSEYIAMIKFYHTSSIFV